LSRIAVAAGAGASVFEHCYQAELLVTGEMRHHELLARLDAGQSVVLCEHSHTERGYLPRLRQRLLEATAERVEVRIAQTDREPLTVV
jgi:putative NIF3 family GTP cyclohydrolase 1 type 2